MLLTRQARASSRPLALRRDRRSRARARREILVRVAACGVCRTDLHVIEGIFRHTGCRSCPAITVVGRVEAAGLGASRFRARRSRRHRLAASNLRALPRYCRDGRENLCPGSRHTGWDADGGYAECATVDERFAYAIPERAFGRRGGASPCAPGSSATAL